MTVAKIRKRRRSVGYSARKKWSRRGLTERVDRADAQMYTRCWPAWIIRTRTTDEVLSRDCRHDRGLGVTTWGSYIFLFSALFPFFFFFYASALSGPRCPITAAGGTWRRLFSSYRVARSVSPRLRDRNPSIYLIDLAGRVWCVESQAFVRRVVSWGSRKSGDAPRDACARTRLAFT